MNSELRAPKTLADILVAHLHDMLRLWMEAVRREAPEAQGLSDADLTSNIPLLFDRLIRGLEGEPPPPTMPESRAHAATAATDSGRREAPIRAGDPTMSPVARAICQALLDHHRLVCPPDGGGKAPDSCLIGYGNLCDRAGVPAVVRKVGHFLQEVAEWCDRSGYPPLNSLAVNRDSRMPGDNYDVAPGCSLLDWPAQAQACIDFTGYPEKAP